MNHENSFVVRRFENRNGVISWRVAGWLHGVRIRKNYKSKEEAAAEKAALELGAMRATAGLRYATTFLADEQLREAEAVFRRLTGSAHSLSFCVEYALTNYKAPIHQKLLDDAVTAYLAVKTAEHEQKLISPSMLTTIERHMAALEKRFPKAMVADLTAAHLTAYFRRGKHCLKTYNNRRGLVSTFLKFAEQQEWLATNPMKKVPYHRIARRRGSAKTLSADEAQKLMTHVESFQNGRLVPFFALCLFGGIRPCLRTGEILRVKPEHVLLETGVIRIEPEVSKIKELRTVAIQPNLAAWLRAYPLKKFPIIIPNLQKYRAKIAKSFGLSHDVMRHTFISMFVAKFRSIGEASLQAGNSESIIKKHYLDLRSATEAEQFFGIMPKKAADPSADNAPAALRAAA